MLALELLLNALRGWWTMPGRPEPALETARSEVVICIGCYPESALLDRVLGPGKYDISFIESVDGAYPHILRVMPGRVILCMRGDDETSLQLLSMLHLDPRTNGIPVFTCIAAVGGVDSVESASPSGLAPVRQDIVMH
jgi:hypothetical protein